MDDIRTIKRHAKENAKALKELSAAVTTAIDAIDLAMKGTLTTENGNKIARIVNALDFANDRARYFHLGVDWRTDKKVQRNTKELKDGA
jgi:hypothetical protein